MRLLKMILKVRIRGENGCGKASLDYESAGNNFECRARGKEGCRTAALEGDLGTSRGTVGWKTHVVPKAPHCHLPSSTWSIVISPSCSPLVLSQIKTKYENADGCEQRTEYLAEGVLMQLLVQYSGPLIPILLYWLKAVPVSVCSKTKYCKRTSFRRWL